MRTLRRFGMAVAVTGVVVLAPGIVGGGIAAQVPVTGASSGIRVDHAGRAVKEGVPPAPVVPGGAPDLATGWLGTTHAHLAVLFSYHREEAGCAGRCEQYGLWLRYEAPSGGAPQPSAEWRQISQAECADFWVDGGQDLTCVSAGGLAGRDRRGNDYVLLQLYASRAQLERMLAAHTLVFQLGGVGFHLMPAGRDSLRSFLASAGRAASR